MYDFIAYNEWGAQSKLTRGECPLNEEKLMYYIFAVNNRFSSPQSLKTPRQY